MSTKQTIFASNSVTETQIYARDFADTLKKHKSAIILYDAPMGAGKTTFTSAVVKGLDANAQLASSPTFTIINQYADNIFHVDLYRLENQNELQMTDFAEIVSSDNFVFIEWSERCTYKFKGVIFRVKIEKGVDANRRLFTIEEHKQ
jgi:tRNA threonylcarbamoyladenosine biosynthesis protein TsaE